MPALPPPVRKAIDAANAADTDAFSALFTPTDGCVDDRGREFRGADAIRRWSDAQLRHTNIRIAVIDFHQIGERETVVIADVSGDVFNGTTTYEFGVDGDRLTNLRIVA